MVLLSQMVSVVPIVLSCVCAFFCPVAAENVLISCSVGEGSHYFVGKTVGKYLAKQGHNVTVLLSYAYGYRAENPDDKELNFIIFNHSVPPEDVLERHRAYSKIALEPIGPSALLNLTTSQREGSVADCEDLLLRNPDVMHRLEDGNFSAVIFDQVWGCSLLLAMKLNTIAVMSNPMSVLAMAGGMIGNPINLAYMPEAMTGYIPPLSFFQRVTNVAVHYMMRFVLYHFNLPFDELRQRLAIRPDIHGTMNELLAVYPSLYLFNMDFATEFPAAFFPNIIPMGGVTAKPASPLNEDLEAYMQSSGEHGVILFTLGTYAHQIREDWLEPFALALGRFPQKVIWQMKTVPPFKLPSNVKTLPWLPQNDILGHPKIRLLIFHGGNNGFYEAQYHGVPVVIVPLTSDNMDSAARTVYHGFGVAVDKTIVTTERLHRAIETVLNNDSYMRVAQRQSQLLRSRPMHPGDRAAFWVSHVMQHGGEYMRNPSLELNLIQRNLLDIIAFLVAVVAFLLVVIFFVCRCLFRCCKGVCFGPKQKQE